MKKYVLSVCAAVIIAVAAFNVNLATNSKWFFADFTLASIVSHANNEYGTCNLPGCSGDISCPYCATTNGATGCDNFAYLDMGELFAPIGCIYGTGYQCAQGSVSLDENGMPKISIWNTFPCPWN